MRGGMVSAILLLVLAVILQSRGSDGARILCVSEHFGSHMLMMHTIGEGLIGHGHEVYTLFSDRKPVPKGLEDKGFKVLRYHTPDTSDFMASDEHIHDMLQSILGQQKVDLASFSRTAHYECTDIDNDAELTKELFELKFDIIIVTACSVSYCLPFISLKLNVPFVLLPSSLDLEVTRNPTLPSFSPSVFSLFTDEMSFLERLHNTYIAVQVNWYRASQFPSLMDTSLLLKYRGNSTVTSWIELARKAELYFHIRGNIVEYPTALAPNVISVECLTCKPGKKLPEAIVELVDDYEGIIVISFGSLIDDLPDSIALKFAEALSNRSELVFWRFDRKLPISIPSNLKMMPWIPQNDLLAHPKTKLFITHSGNNGQHESVYHGVPMIAFPMFADQPHNAVRIVKHGFGLKADILNFTANELSEKINEIIQNPLYREKTQRAGQIMKSSPMNPQDKAAYWIEYVLEFGGDHLRSHALKMPWYAFYMIDVILFVEGVLAVSACVLGYICLYMGKRIHVTGFVIHSENRSRIECSNWVGT